MPRCENCEFQVWEETWTECGTEYDGPFCAAGIPEEKRVSFPCGFGTELGCRHHHDTLKKMRDKLQEEYDRYIYETGIGMGLMLQEEDEVWKERAIELMEHTLGMDNRQTYKRWGKEFYRPYRNYWCGEDRTMDSLVTFELARTWQGNREKFYAITDKGRVWLGNQIGVVIHEEED